MKAIIKKPFEKPKVIEIENELSALQEAVGGYIEVLPIAEDICVLCNEEGKLLGAPAQHSFVRRYPRGHNPHCRSSGRGVL